MCNPSDRKCKRSTKDAFVLELFQKRRVYRQTHKQLGVKLLVHLSAYKRSYIQENQSYDNRKVFVRVLGDYEANDEMMMWM
jgi:hypothetical protein